MLMEPHRNTAKPSLAMHSLSTVGQFLGAHKQELVMLFIAEVEYVAMMHTAKESIWPHHLTGDILPPSEEPMTLYSNNQAALRLTQDNNYHA